MHLINLEILYVGGNPLIPFPIEILKVPEIKMAVLPLKFKGEIDDERVEFR